VSVRLGVCSWSLQPDGPEDLARKLQRCSVDAVQLALGPLGADGWDEGATRAQLEAAGISLASGMLSTHAEDYSSLETIRATGGLRPDAHWERNLETARREALLARRLGLDLVTFHAGFLPEDAGDPERERLLTRLRTFCDVFADQGVRLGFETGQESAHTLLEVLSDLGHTNAGVNFDPANMILYGMGDPVEALGLLRAHVFQIHVKDALPTAERGTWGSEVAVGTGAVDWAAFFQIAGELEVDFMIEREAGAERVADILLARDVVRAHVDLAGSASA